MPLFDFERWLFLQLHGFNIAGINEIMFFFSGFTPWLPLALLLAGQHWSKFNRNDYLKLISLCLLLLAVTDTSASYLFKNVFQRLRPCKMPELKAYIVQLGQGCGGKWGFFSSHAANSVALTVFLVTVSTTKRWIKVLSTVVVALVCYSRIYLGVHLPLDIIVGCIWGALLAWPWSFIARMSLKEQVVP